MHALYNVLHSLLLYTAALSNRVQFSKIVMWAESGKGHSALHLLPQQCGER